MFFPLGYVTEEDADNIISGFSRVEAKRKTGPSKYTEKILRRFTEDDNLEILTSDTKDNGFLCEVRVDNYDDKYLFVHLGYSNIKLNYEALWESVRDYAKNKECKYVEFSTERSGWMKKNLDFMFDHYSIDFYRKNV